MPFDGVVIPPKHGLSLCAGGGGLDMGLELAEPGFTTACYVEIEKDAREVLIAAQRNGYFKPAPIWDDLKTFDARPWRGICDTLLAGYPCQPFSAAGQRKGKDDPRHLWPDICRIIRELQPRWIFLENVRGHVSLGLDTVLRDLRAMGYVASAGIFSAEEIGAPQERQRVFIVAYRESSDGRRELQPGATGRRRAGLAGSIAELEDPKRPRAGSGTQTSSERRRDTMDGRGKGIRRANRALGSNGVATDGEGNRPELDHPTSPRHQPKGQRAEAHSGGRKRLPSTGRDDLASGNIPGPQGQQSNKHYPQRWQVSDGHAGLRSGTGIFPPGPSDREAWAEILSHGSDHAPAIALDDVVSLANRLQSDLKGPFNAASQPRLRRMAYGLARRARALRLLGNGVVPLQAAYAWRSLSASLGLGWVDLGGSDADARTGADGV